MKKGPAVADLPTEPRAPKSTVLSVEAEAVSLPLVGKLPRPGTKFRVRWAARTVSDHLPIRTDNAAGPTLRQAHDDLQMRDGVALHGGPYQFFDTSSRIAATSSICSANSFFSFAFSSSSCFSRLASDTSMPPSLAFQLYSVASAIRCFRCQIGDLRADLVLLQDCDNLLFRES